MLIFAFMKSTVVLVIYFKMINRSDRSIITYELAVTMPIRSSNTIWIGLNELRAAGVYEWSDGSPVMFTRWGSYQPDNKRGTTPEKCVEFSVWVTISLFVCKNKVNRNL